jgi:hypothetical protein
MGMSGRCAFISEEPLAISLSHPPLPAERRTAPATLSNHNLVCLSEESGLLHDDIKCCKAPVRKYVGGAFVYYCTTASMRVERCALDNSLSSFQVDVKMNGVVSS